MEHGNDRILLEIKFSQLEEISDNNSLLEDKIDAAMREQSPALADWTKHGSSLLYTYRVWYQ